MHILIIDDNADVLLTTGMLFKMKGCRVTTLDGPEKVPESVREENPDMIIMDIGLPGKNGYDLCRELRDAGFQKPIVAHTGWGSEEDRERAQIAGFNDILVKPTSSQDYQDLLDRYSGEGDEKE